MSLNHGKEGQHQDLAGTAVARPALRLEFVTFFTTVLVVLLIASYLLAPISHTWNTYMLIGPIALVVLAWGAYSRGVLPYHAAFYYAPAMVILGVGVMTPEIKAEGMLLAPLCINAIRRVRDREDYFRSIIIMCIVMGIVLLVDYQWLKTTDDITFGVINASIVIFGLTASIIELSKLLDQGYFSNWRDDINSALKLMPDSDEPLQAVYTIQALFEGLFANSGDGIEIVKLSNDEGFDGDTLMRNAKMDEIFEKGKNYMTIEDYLPLFGDNLDEKQVEFITKKFKELRERLVREHDIKFEVILRKDGIPKKYDAMYRIVTIMEDRYILRVFTDVTEVAKQRREIQRKNVELEKYIESNMNLSKFAAVASHDLNSPLRTINSFGKLLKAKYEKDLPEGAQEYVDIIIDSSKSMQHLVKDILDYSAVDKKKFNYQEINPEATIKQMLQGMQSDIDDINAKIVVKDMPESVKADEVKLKQLVGNLVKNALKFQQEGAKPKVKISCSDKGSYWQFAVKDNGIGIEEKHQKRIFEIFSRLHTQSQYEGSGIGLATCTQIVQGHKGRIWVESEIGEGSTFYFTLRKELP